MTLLIYSQRSDPSADVTHAKKRSFGEKQLAAKRQCCFDIKGSCGFNDLQTMRMRKQEVM